MRLHWILKTTSTTTRAFEINHAHSEGRYFQNVRSRTFPAPRRILGTLRRFPRESGASSVKYFARRETKTKLRNSTARWLITTGGFNYSVRLDFRSRKVLLFNITRDLKCTCLPTPHAHPSACFARATMISVLAGKNVFCEIPSNTLASVHSDARFALSEFQKNSKGKKEKEKNAIIGSHPAENVLYYGESVFGHVFLGEVPRKFERDPLGTGKTTWNIENPDTSSPVIIIVFCYTAYRVYYFFQLNSVFTTYYDRFVWMTYTAYSYLFLMFSRTFFSHLIFRRILTHKRKA